MSFEGPENSAQLKKKKGLLDSTVSKLGLETGTETLAPRLRSRASELSSPLGLSNAADIEVEKRKANGDFRALQSNPATTALAKTTGQTKQEVIRRAAGNQHL